MKKYRLPDNNSPMKVLSIPDLNVLPYLQLDSLDKPYVLKIDTAGILIEDTSTGRSSVIYWEDVGYPR